MTIPLAAERLAAQWASRQGTLTGAREQSLTEHVLTQLADPRSDYGELLNELCRRRWRGAGVAS